MKLPASIAGRDSIPRRQLAQALLEMRADVLEQLANAPEEKAIRVLQGRAQVLKDLATQLGV